MGRRALAVGRSGPLALRLRPAPLGGDREGPRAPAAGFPDGAGRGGRGAGPRAPAPRFRARPRGLRVPPRAPRAPALDGGPPFDQTDYRLASTSGLTGVGGVLP